MATVGELREIGAREFGRKALEKFAASNQDYVLYGLIFLILTWTGINTLLLLEVAGYTASSVSSVFELFRLGMYALGAFVLLEALRAVARGHVRRTD